MIKLNGKEKKILFYLADTLEKQPKKPWVNREQLGKYLGGAQGLFDASETIFVLNLFGLAEYHPRDRRRAMISQQGLQYVKKRKPKRKSKGLFGLW